MKSQTHTGFDSTKQISIGNHFALLYDNEEERLDVLAKFIKAGIKEDEKIIYLVDDDNFDYIGKEMQKRGIDILNSDRFYLDTAEHGYCPAGTFIIEKMLESTEDFSTSALKEGFTSSRGSGEMTWALKKLNDSENLMTYEALLTNLLKKTTYIAICQYDTRRFSGQTILDILRTHPYVISKGKLIQNPYFMEADDFLKIMSPHAL